jgi:hypothetical protein
MTRLTADYTPDLKKDKQAIVSIWVFSIAVILFVLILSSCASVNSKGINYFVGRAEKDLVKYFGYNGVIQSFDENNDYDKIVFLTNKVIKYQVSKVNTVQYKVSRRTQVMLLTFNEFSDGCVTYNDAKYYGMHIGIEGLPPNAYTVHRNDNAALVPQINQFNNLINRYTAYPSSQSNEAFNRSKIGDSYYLYEKSSKGYWNPGVTGLTQGESYTGYIWGLWKIDIVAENRSETEGYIIGQYNERQNQYYSGNGNSVITVPQINSLIDDYKSKGFTYTTKTEGYSLFAYLKNGKVVRVEENNEK